MNEHLRKIMKMLAEFARPEFYTKPHRSIKEIDTKISNLNERQKEIAARLKLIDIQGTPRGGLYG